MSIFGFLQIYRILRAAACVENKVENASKPSGKSIYFYNRKNMILGHER